MRTLAGAVVGVLCLVASAYGQSPAFTLNKLLLTGDLLPSGERVDEIGAYVDAFNPDPFDGAPELSDQGGASVVVLLGGDGNRATRDSTGSGVWRWTPSGASIVTRTGEVAPGTTARTFLGFPQLFAATPFDTVDGVAFPGTVDSADGAGRTGLWSSRSGDLHKVLLEGEPLPGTPAGSTASGFAFVGRESSIVVDAAWCEASGCSLNFEGLFRDRDGIFAPVVLGGEPAPGMPRGVVFGDSGNASANTGPIDVWNASPAGRVIFTGVVVGPRIGEKNNEALWVEGVSGLTLLAREGEKVPGKPGYTWGSATGFRSFGDFTVMRAHILTRSGAALWGASVNTRKYNRLGGVWTTRSGAIVQLVQTVFLFSTASSEPPQTLASPAPGFGDGFRFRQVFSGRMNDAGEVYLDADVVHEDQPTGPVGSGIFRIPSNSSAIELLARRGGPVPDVPGAVFAEIAIGRLFDTGHYIWTARLAGDGVTSANDLGAFVTHGGVTNLLFRSGDALDVSGNGTDVRTIASFHAASDPRPAGAPVRQVFEVLFTDGSAGIFLLTM